MGHFQSVDERERYYNLYCAKCKHEYLEGGCALWYCQMVNNEREKDDSKSILHVLIPKEEYGNGRCEMFVPQDET